ncbi:hypothetical protein, partial [Pseudomonas sp. GW704-F3]|uniref:hypothetical protein n=1 Tax=Pseudomonas sp. GW704-F3 TaxID=2070574 RepID=UPI0013049F51
ANTAPDEASKCYEAGMNGFLNKPFIAADLQQLVGNTLAKTASNNLNTISASEEKHYNLSFIKELLGGDDSSLKPVIETFINSVPPLLE